MVSERLQVAGREEEGQVKYLPPYRLGQGLGGGSGATHVAHTYGLEGGRGPRGAEVSAAGGL